MDLSLATLEGANLHGASLYFADLRGIRAQGADFRGANLEQVNLKASLLEGANVFGAVLKKADFTFADVADIRYRHYVGIWPFRRNVTLGRYLGVRGLDSCYGDPGFRRDALDQDFIDDKFHDSMFLLRGGWKNSIDAVPDVHIRWIGSILNSKSIKAFRSVRWSELPVRIPRRFFFWLWYLSDFGRSIVSVALFAAAIIGFFGWFYWAYLIPVHVSVTGELARLPRDIPYSSWYAAAKPRASTKDRAEHSHGEMNSARDVASDVRTLLAAGNAAQALALLQDSGDARPTCRELVGVCQMRLGKTREAVSTFSEVLFPHEETTIPDSASPRLIANYATAQLLTGDIRGAKKTLDQVWDKDNRAISQLLVAIDQWEQSLSFKERMTWRFGGAPPKSLHLDPPHGEI